MYRECGVKQTTVPTLKVFFHDACFDGTASTAVFWAFSKDVLDRALQLVVQPMHHTDGDPYAGLRFDADMHACVDFRYSANPSLTWWFDHHRTAFQPPSLRTQFDQRNVAQHVFDPMAPSCAGLIARSVEATHGWRPPLHLRDVLTWADRIDAAAYASAEEATRLDTAAQQLALWVSRNSDSGLVAHYIALLASGGLGAALDDMVIARGVREVVAQQDATRALWRNVAQARGQVAFFDLRASGEAAPGLFAYAAMPTCRYSIAVLRNEHTVKVSVGRNPWAPGNDAFADADIGALCAAWGGGGHFAVGGITLARTDEARAEAAVHDLLARLGG